MLVRSLMKWHLKVRNFVIGFLCEAFPSQPGLCHFLNARHYDWLSGKVLLSCTVSLPANCCILMAFVVLSHVLTCLTFPSAANPYKYRCVFLSDDCIFMDASVILNGLVWVVSFPHHMMLHFGNGR